VRKVSNTEVASTLQRRSEASGHQLVCPIEGKIWKKQKGNVAHLQRKNRENQKFLEI